ncbi:isoprenyl transferase [Oceanobacillus salinisoli]|uniref:isoprenyl transferase n=1 Tax=Oceanobacillus salinisoli TaxID=2678611 RepID=UPI0012E2E49D|nr:isoprenyl transferase [Oceanobacillus salinisoli]
MSLWVPNHVAIIMDGNGRWGKSRGLSRSEGHFAGTQAMEKIIDACVEMNIKVLTLYAFSTENWSRPADEVNYLMYLPVKFFNKKLPGFMKKNIRILVSGNIASLPDSTRKAVIKAVEQTKSNDGLIVNFALNYSGRSDILQAVRHLVLDIQHKKIDINQLDENYFQQFLYTKTLPDPEIIIRTGGEKRISNFLIWQSAQAELYFSDVYFPDFNKDLFRKAIAEVQKKHRIGF